MVRRWCLTACVSLAFAGAPWLAAGNRPVVRAYVVHHGEPTWVKLFAAFERETEVRVQASYACRGANLVDLAAEGRDGDLLITDSADNVAQLVEKRLVRSAPVRVGEVTPVIQVMKRNPKKIAALADLARPGVRVVLCFQKGCLGRVSDAILAQSGLTAEVSPRFR